MDLLTPIRFQPGRLELLDQTRLPNEEIWVACSDVETVARAIETMIVRGAPAIGCTAAFGLALSLSDTGSTWADERPAFEAACKRLSETRPTAVNLFHGIEWMKQTASQFTDSTSVTEARSRLQKAATTFYEDDIKKCQSMGRHGAELAQGDKKLRVLTHCNAGALATSAYGTALGVIRELWNRGRLEKVYVDETRPFLQGARLTAYELQDEGIPYELIVDSTAATLMNQGKIDWVVVGADRIAANGDAANKIGTYSVAVNAKHHNVSFFVAAPFTTFDRTLDSGADIPVEQRDSTEITHFRGEWVAPKQAQVFNPSFDVTPHELITAIITEQGVIKAPTRKALDQFFERCEA